MLNNPILKSELREFYGDNIPREALLSHAYSKLHGNKLAGLSIKAENTLYNAERANTIAAWQKTGLSDSLNLAMRDMRLRNKDWFDRDINYRSFLRESGVNLSRNGLAEEIALNRAVLDKLFKGEKVFIYRGLKLPDDVLKQVKSQKGRRIKDFEANSWTLDINTAKKFVTTYATGGRKLGSGVIIKEELTLKDVVSFDGTWNKTLKQKEVIMAGKNKRYKLDKDMILIEDKKTIGELKKAKQKLSYNAYTGIDPNKEDEEYETFGDE